jgi:hypothetical protein
MTDDEINFFKYEVDPLECPRCHSPMKVIAVITEPEEVQKIPRNLVKIGRGRFIWGNISFLLIYYLLYSF